MSKKGIWRSGHQALQLIDTLAFAPHALPCGKVEAVYGRNDCGVPPRAQVSQCMPCVGATHATCCVCRTIVGNASLPCWGHRNRGFRVSAGVSARKGPEKMGLCALVRCQWSWGVRFGDFCNRALKSLFPWSKFGRLVEAFLWGSTCSGVVGAKTAHHVARGSTGQAVFSRLRCWWRSSITLARSAYPLSPGCWPLSFLSQRPQRPAHPVCPTSTPQLYLPSRSPTPRCSRWS